MTKKRGKYICRKYGGDDSLSWAIFKKEDLKGMGKGIIMPGQALPVETSMGKYEADSRRNQLNQLQGNTRKRKNVSD